MPIHETTLTAPAKINLHLRILGIRDDGYHELRTLFHPVPALHDTITIEPGSGDDFFMRCPDNPELESASNLIYKAWKAFGEMTGYRPGVFLTLTKRIPMGGGLGGGSSDGATMLRWLNEHAGDRALSQEQLMALAAGLGADVPFFLMNGPAWAGGIGEQLTPIHIDMSGMTLIVACPDIHVNTAWAFRTWDEANGFPTATSLLTTPELGTKNPALVSPLVIVNDFEPIVFSKHPVLRRIKEKLIFKGASAAAMSGSGASLFGLFRDSQVAEDAAVVLEQDGIQVFRQIF